jgi:Icc protein
MPIRVVQISDCHLFKDVEGRLLGMKTQDSLERVLTLVKQDLPYDIALCTGDLVQDASIAGYKRFRQMIDELAIPQYWIPGNHDVRANMQEATRNSSILHPVIHIGAWQIIMLDSTIEGAVPGLMSDATLDFLDKKLTMGKRLHTLVCLHHQPIPIGANWLDNLGVQNAADFLSVLDRHDNVRAVLWGHVHQQFDEERNNIPFMATPSTCIQFTPKSNDFSVDSLPPGYRALTLHSDGRVESMITRVQAFDFEIDYSVKGY